MIGQVLELAANAVSYWPVEKLQATYEARCRSKGSDPEERLQTFLENAADSAGFWATVKTSVKAGKIRICRWVTNPSEVRRIVEFLNGQMTTAEELLAVDQAVRQRDAEDIGARVYGQTRSGLRLKF